MLFIEMVVKDLKCARVEKARFREDGDDDHHTKE